MNFRTRILALFAGTVLSVASGNASTITQSASDHETISNLFWSYTISINNGGNVQGSGTFTQPYLADRDFSLTFTPPPAGSTIDGATLDLGLLLNSSTIETELFSHTGPFLTTYLPGTSADPVQTFVSLTINGITHNIAASGGAVDLLGAGMFTAADLMSGHIDIAWQQNLTLSLDDTNWVRDKDKAYANSSGTYHVQGSATATANADLTLDYTAGATVSEVPEPGSFSLVMGAGLIGIASFLRSRNSSKKTCSTR